MQGEDKKLKPKYKKIKDAQQTSGAVKQDWPYFDEMGAVLAECRRCSWSKTAKNLTKNISQNILDSWLKGNFTQVTV